MNPISNQGTLIYYNIGVKYKIEIEMIYIYTDIPTQVISQPENPHIRPLPLIRHISPGSFHPPPSPC